MTARKLWITDWSRLGVLVFLQDRASNQRRQLFLLSTVLKTGSLAGSFPGSKQQAAIATCILLSESSKLHLENVYQGLGC